MPRRSIGKAYTLGIVVCLLVSSAIVAVAQNRMLWQGSVKLERIAVYSQPSTNELVIRTLKHGEVVDAILEVNVLDSAWCRVQSPGEAEPMGYVLCMNLQKGRFTSQAATPTAGSVQASSMNAAALSNQDILEMTKVGLQSDVLVAKIKSSQCNFDTSPQQLQQLKANGVPDAVILAMVQAQPGQPSPGASTNAPFTPDQDVDLRALCSRPTVECRQATVKKTQHDLEERTNGSGDLALRTSGMDDEILAFTSPSLLFDEQYKKNYLDVFLQNASVVPNMCIIGFTGIVLRKDPDDRGYFYSLPCLLTSEKSPSPTSKLNKKAQELCSKHQDWTARQCSLIAQHRVAIGMTHEMVLASWRRPKGMTKSIVEGSFHERWVYMSRLAMCAVSADDYVYFENGLVSGIQGFQRLSMAVGLFQGRREFLVR
jgi:hypothetical protein